MCNRFRAAYFTRPAFEEQFQAWDEIVDSPQPRHNVAPTQPVATVRLESGKRKVTMMRWGLIPSWASGITSANFNARSESVTASPTFRDLIETNRCLIPADAFYEWQEIGGVKQPFAFDVGDRKLFAFAGLWDEWIGPDNKTIESCTILTTAPNSRVAEIHGRMPVILAKKDYQVWLDSKSPLQEILNLLTPYAGDMRSYPVSTRLNNSQNDDASLSDPIELEKPTQGSLF